LPTTDSDLFVLDHAVDVRRAQRAAALIGALENWLDNNAPLDLAT
jgi:hypothetical protein